MNLFCVKLKFLKTNLNAYKHKNKNECFLIFSYKNNDTLNQHTQTKAQGILKSKLAKSRQSFSFDIPLKLKGGEWILNSTKLEVYN